MDGGDQKSIYCIVNNYFKPGPGTPNTDIAFRLLKPESERSKTVVDHFGKAYVNGNIVEGNERVVRPRLADAKFFFDQDRKKTLESRVPALAKVVYNGKLGAILCDVVLFCGLEDVVVPAAAARGDA